MSSTLESLLLKAIETNDIPTVSLLIEKGVNVNYIPSPLAVAAERGYVEIMTMLLDAGADIDEGFRIKTIRHVFMPLPTNALMHSSCFSTAVQKSTPRFSKQPHDTHKTKR
jgi:ankyrin repeat protein